MLQERERNALLAAVDDVIADREKLPGDNRHETPRKPVSVDAANYAIRMLERLARRTSIFDGELTMKIRDARATLARDFKVDHGALPEVSLEQELAADQAEILV